MIAMLYFIQETQEPYRIKIGFSKDPHKRIAVLAAMLPQPVRILKIIEGDRVDESWHHDFLRQFRVEGTREWYYPYAELLDFLDTGDVKFAG